MWVSHIVYLMWNITNDVVNQECKSSNSHFHIENSSIAYNWHSIERVQFKFHQNYKMEISFSFCWKFWPTFLFSNTFFFIFSTKKIGTKSQMYFYFIFPDGNSMNFSILLEIFTNFLISQILKREKPSLHHYLLLLTHSNQLHIIIFKLEENLSFG